MVSTNHLKTVAGVSFFPPIIEKQQTYLKIGIIKKKL